MSPVADLVRLTTAGSVDDGKSTLIGRLLLETGSVCDDQVRSVRQASRQKGFSDIDPSLFTDGLQAEREQQITIDVAYRYFSTPKRRFVIADVPGHEQYTRNMATGASTAEVALVLVDARHGVVTQSRRHLYLCSLLGIGHVLIVVNKMDEVGYEEAVFARIEAEIARLARRLPIGDIHVMPASALGGDMVVARGGNMPWYAGPTLLDYLETVRVQVGRNLDDARLPIQHVLRPHQNFRGFAGRLESGVLRVGDPVVVLPGGTTSTVASISVAGDQQPEGCAGDSIVVTLADHVDASRGSMIAGTRIVPTVASHIEAVVCWFSPAPLENGRSYLLKHTTQTVRAYVDRLRDRVNVDTLGHEQPERLHTNDIGRVCLTTASPLVVDSYDRNRGTGSFILIDERTRETAGAGVIVRTRDAAPSAVDPRRLTAVRGAIVWFTGLPASGKTTVAAKLADRLRASGIRVEHLDGDEFRRTLSRDLGFSADDRTRNIERASLVAGLLAKHGIIVLASFVSPARAHRSIVKAAASDVFEVFVNAPLEVCIQRDPKGMYREAKTAVRPRFTGVDDDYEPPETPDLELRTDEMPVDESVDAVLDMLAMHRILL